MDYPQAVADAHQRLLDSVASLSNEQVHAPSLLPAWSRGHVLAHLHDNAVAMSRLTREALAGRRIEMYDGGRTHRDAAINLGARLDADTHRRRLLAAISDLDSLWSELPTSGWERPIDFPGDRVVDAARARLREVEIHLVDLDVDVTPSSWSVEFVLDLIDFVLPTVRDRLKTDMRVEFVATDRTKWQGSVGTSEPSIRIHGAVNDIAAWLVGRAPDGHLESPQGRIPRLAPWD